MHISSLYCSLHSHYFSPFFFHLFPLVHLIFTSLFTSSLFFYLKQFSDYYQIATTEHTHIHTLCSSSFDDGFWFIWISCLFCSCWICHFFLGRFAYSLALIYTHSPPQTMQFFLYSYSRLCSLLIQIFQIIQILLSTTISFVLSDSHTHTYTFK